MVRGQDGTELQEDRGRAIGDKCLGHDGREIGTRSEPIRMGIGEAKKDHVFVDLPKAFKIRRSQQHHDIPSSAFPRGKGLACSASQHSWYKLYHEGGFQLPTLIPLISELQKHVEQPAAM